MKQTMFTYAYLSEFYMELYLIIRAGIPFQEGVALLMEEEQNTSKKAFLQILHQQLEQGATLAMALESTAMPHYAVKMVAIGQTTGYLEQVFYALSRYYERMDQTRQSIHNMIWYPMILLLMMLFVVLVLLIKVMPIFADIFQQLGTELSVAAQMMLQLGQVLRLYGIPVIAVLAVLFVTIYLWGKTATGATQIEKLLLRITSSWKIRERIVASKLADSLVLTLSSGMNIDEALDMAGQLVEEPIIQDKITACKKAMLLDGKSFADASMEHALFAPIYCRMLAIGFRTGGMDTIMQEVANRIADDADDAMDALLNRIEPALVIVLSLMVGMILLSVMLPLVGIMTAIG